MIDTFRKSLNILVSLTLALPSYGFAQAEPPAPGEPVGDVGTSYEKMAENAERPGPGQPLGTFPADRFLYMNQEVFPLEVSSLGPIDWENFGRIEGPSERRTRLKILLARTKAELEKLPQSARQPNPETDANDALHFARMLFFIYGRVNGGLEIEPAKLNNFIALVQQSTEAATFIRLVSPHVKLRESEEEAITNEDERVRALSASMLEFLTKDHILEQRRRDMPLFLFEAQDPAHPSLANDPVDMHRRAVRLLMIRDVFERIQERWNWKTAYGEFNPTEGPVKAAKRAINWWDTRIEVTEGDQRVKTLSLRDAAKGRPSGDAQLHQCPSGTCHFSIWKDKTLLHSYGIDATAIATIDQFVVFTHPNGYDAESGTEHLLFLDLGKYTNLIGNENIPVFHAPVKTDAPVRELRAENGRLVLNGDRTLDRIQLKLASDLQEPVHNLTANLLSPDSWPKVLPLVDTVQVWFDEIISQSRQFAANERENAKSAHVMLDQLANGMQESLDRLKARAPMPKKDADDLKALAQDAANENVRKQYEIVSKSQVLAKAMNDAHEQQRLSRKLGARVRLLASALVSPRPNAGQYIKQAVAATWVRKGKTFKGMLDRVAELGNRPFVTAGAIAAGITAMVAPESFNHMLEAGLGVGVTTADYVVSTLGHIGEAVATGTHKTLEPVAGDSVLRQYVYDGNGFRAAVGIPAFIAFLGGLYFVPHFIFNYAQLRRDMRNPEIKSFADRMEKVREAYYKRIADEEGERRHTDSDFSPAENAQVAEFIETRREEIARGGIVKRAIRWVKRPFNAAISKASNFMQDAGATDVLKDSLANQNIELHNAIELAGQSPALDRAEKDKNEDFKNFWSAVKANAFGAALAGPLEAAYQTIVTNAKPAKDFMLSPASLELTLERWANVWNQWAMWRFATFGYGHVPVLGSWIPVWPMKPRPISFASKILYPEFMTTVATRKIGQPIIPTVLNGGLRKRFTGDTVGTARGDATIDPSTGAEVLNAAAWDPREELNALKKFEDQIIEVEKAVSEVAFRQSLEALAQYMTDPEDMQKFFNSPKLSSVYQPEINDLSWRARTFLRAHYEAAFNAGMAKFLGDEVDRIEGPAEDVNIGTVQVDPLPTPAKAEAEQMVDPNQEAMGATLKELKRRLARANVQRNGQAADYGFKVDQAKDAAAAVVRDVAHVQTARAAVNEGRLSLTNYRMNTKYDLIGSYDPSQPLNKSMKRVATVKKRLESPGALGRAVRSEITKLTLTVPIELTARLLLTAGLFEGVMKPIQEEFLGPNSIFYLSGTSFYMMMASGFFMSMMGDAWIKLQQDAFQDELGKFGDIPMGDDARKSALNWYMKQFNSRENTLWKNYTRNNSIVFWNMPAALANISLFNFMFSGRVDISYIMAMFIIGYTTPINAFMYKIDQGFERFVHYPARGAKEKWTAHPDIQKLLLPEMQKLRYRLAIFKDILTTTQGDWLSNVEMVPTSLGTRGLQRAFFGGGLLEEYIINKGLTPLQHAVTGVPVLEQIVKPIAKGCAAVLSTGNTDLKLIK